MVKDDYDYDQETMLRTPQLSALTFPPSLEMLLKELHPQLLSQGRLHPQSPCCWPVGHG